MAEKTNIWHTYGTKLRHCHRIYTPHLKSVSTPVTLRYMKGGAKVENGMVIAKFDRGQQHLVRGHSRSSVMSPFDRAHSTFYSTLMKTMRLSCIVFEK